MVTRNKARLVAQGFTQIEGLDFGETHCRGVKTVASMLFESVSEYRVSGGSGELKNTRITQRRRNGLSWFESIRSLRPAADDPYTQENPKSGGLQQSVKEESLVGG